MKKKLRGTGIALATPMNHDYSVDYQSLGRLLDHIVQGNADYVVVQGTTGEASTFSWADRLEILQFVFDHLQGKKHVVFGLGSNNTFDLIERSKELKDFDLTAILSVNPYYSKPSQKGILRHYDMLANASPHPIILYNVPSRTGSNMDANTTIELGKHENIVAIKEASGDLLQYKKIIDDSPDKFMLIAGDDALANDTIKMGGEGIISVIGNIIPQEFTTMINATLNKDFKTGDRINDDLQIPYQMLSEEGNPSSLKAGLEAIGIGKRTVRPPLFDASDLLVAKWKDYFSRL